MKNALRKCIFYSKIYEMEKYMLGNESDCKFVSSRGIMKSCDVYSSNPTSSTVNLDGIDFNKLTDGSIVYVTGSAIPEFVKRLHSLPCKVVVVSGDCDETIPYAVFHSDINFRNFIDSDKIIHWFSQNSAGEHPKLSRIPIGLDYHTYTRTSNISAQAQETELLAIKASVKPFYERIIKCYSTFHFNMQMNRRYTGDRRDAIQKIPADLIFKEPTPISRKETYINQSKYAFVASPHGNGLDCHRTWEALILGCIPIVKTSPIDKLFDELPVLIVQDWADITPELLQFTVNAYKNTKFNYDKLTLAYWVNKIKSAK